MKLNLIKMLSIFIIIYLLFKFNIFYSEGLHERTVHHTEAINALSDELAALLEAEDVLITIETADGKELYIKSHRFLRGNYEYKVGSSEQTLIKLPRTILDDPIFSQVPIARKIAYFLLDFAYDDMLFIVRFLIVWYFFTLCIWF